MAKLSFLEIVSVALFVSLILWHETSSSYLDPSSSVTEETTTTKGRGCAGFKCPYYGRCVVDSDNGRPKCVCPPGCPKNLRSVCGSDNETYDNECMLQMKSCERKINITVARRGRCDGECMLQSVAAMEEHTATEGCGYGVEECQNNKNTTVAHTGESGTDCAGIKCPNYGRCDFDDAQNRSMCVCRFGCPRIRRPVCGSDNQTYSNDCVLRSVACETNTSITVLHKGECGIGGSSGLGCEVVLCPPGKICVPNNNTEPECVCTIRLCPYNYRPVCGSDNVTYPNDCSRLREACQTNRNISVLHQGRCEDGGLGCENVLCPPGKFCVPNNNTDPECVCTKLCPAIYRPVCGSDNVTYSNDCELLREACQNNTNITVIRHERCEDGGSRCDGISCPHRKSCDPNSGECHCDTACTKEHAPVCASNGKTYGNRCEFDVAVCLYDDNSMTVIHDGPCGTDS